MPSHLPEPPSGATRDEAITAAKAEYGSDVRIRGVRRIRSGGVAGFFSSERYVADVVLPDDDAAPRPGAARSVSAGTPAGSGRPASSAGLASAGLASSSPAPAARPVRATGGTTTTSTGTPATGASTDDAPAQWPAAGLSVDDLLEVALQVRGAQRAADETPTGILPTVDPVDELADLLGSDSAEVEVYSPTSLARPAASSAPRAAQAQAPVRTATTTTPDDAAPPARTPGGRRPLATRRAPDPVEPTTPAWERTSRADLPAVEPTTEPADDQDGTPPSPFAAALMRVVTGDDEVQAAVAGATEQEEQRLAADQDTEPSTPEAVATADPTDRVAAVRQAAARAEAEALAAARVEVTRLEAVRRAELTARDDRPALASAPATADTPAPAAPVRRTGAGAPADPRSAERREAARARAAARRAARAEAEAARTAADQFPVEADVVEAEVVEADVVEAEVVEVPAVASTPVVPAPAGTEPAPADATSRIALGPRPGMPAAAHRPPARTTAAAPTRVTSARAGAAQLRAAAIRAAGELAERTVAEYRAPDLLDEFVDADLAAAARPAAPPTPLADRAARLRSVLAAAVPHADPAAPASAAGPVEELAADEGPEPARRALPAVPPRAPARPAVRPSGAESTDDPAGVAAAATEAARIAEAERVTAELAEAERREAGRIEAQRLAAAERAEARRIVVERMEAQRIEAQRVDAERRAAQQAEAQRIAAERAERAEAQRIAAERAEAQRLAAEQAAAEQAEAQRIAAEQAAEARRVAAEQAAAAEAERVAAEQAEARRRAAEQAEARRIAAAADQAEARRLAAERDEAARVAAETRRLAEEQAAEAERVVAERAAAVLATDPGIEQQSGPHERERRTRAQRREAAELARAAARAGATPEVPEIDPLWGTPVRRPLSVVTNDVVHAGVEDSGIEDSGVEDSGRHRGAGTGLPVAARRTTVSQDVRAEAAVSVDAIEAAVGVEAVDAVEAVVGVVLDDRGPAFPAGSRYDEILFGSSRATGVLAGVPRDGQPDPLDALRATLVGVGAGPRRRRGEPAGRHRTTPTQVDLPAVGAARLAALEDPAEATSGFIESLQAVADSDFVAVPPSADSADLAAEVSAVLVQEMAHEMAAGMAEELARTASDPAPPVMDATTVLPSLNALVPTSTPRVRGQRPPVPPAQVARSRTLPPHPSSRSRTARGGDDGDGWATITHLVPVTDEPATPDGGPAGLAALGVPASVLGADFAAQAHRRGTFAALATALGRALPAAPAIPSEPGDVLVVVGPGAEALTAARGLAVALRLDPARVQWVTRGALAGLAAADVQVSGAAVAAARRAAAADADVPTVVAVDVPLGDAGGAWAAQMLQAWAPTAVWGVLDSTRKAGALRGWLAGLPRVDAVVVTDTESAPDPAALLDGLPVPVAVVDGARATPHRWAALLCERLAGRS